MEELCTGYIGPQNTVVPGGYPHGLRVYRVTPPWPEEEFVSNAVMPFLPPDSEAPDPDTQI